MDKIFRDSTDRDVAATYVYGKSSDSFAYADSNCTVKIKTTKLQEVFLKGAVVVIDGNCYKPVSYSIKSNIGCLTYIKSDTKVDSKTGSSSSTVALATINAIAD